MTRALEKSIVGLLLGGALLLAAGDARAFCRMTTCKVGRDACDVDESGCVTTGTPLRWRKLPLEFRFSAARPGSLVREEARAAIRAAFYRWSDTLCGADQRRTSLRFVEGEEIGEEKPLVANSRGAASFGIYFRDIGWPYEGKVDATLAQTNNVYGKTSGFIEYADIEINSGTKRFSTKEEESGIDLQAVMTHEVGHYIGLSHSREPSTIMAERYCEEPGRCDKGKVAARRLSDDDIDAVCTLFPPDGIPDDAAAEEPAKASDGGCTTGGGAPTLSAALGLAAFLAVAASRRRRR